VMTMMMNIKKKAKKNMNIKR